MALYELFELVGQGNGDYGSEWKRIAVRHDPFAAKSISNLHRTESPNAHFRMFFAKSASSVGKLLWDFPPLNFLSIVANSRASTSGGMVASYHCPQSRYSTNVWRVVSETIRHRRHSRRWPSHSTCSHSS